MTTTKLTLGDADASVVVAGEMPTPQTECPPPSDDVQRLRDHLCDPESDAGWSQQVIGQIAPSDIVRACQLVADELDLDTFTAQEAVRDQGRELTAATRRFMRWVFAARVRLRGLMPYLRPAVALTFLPPGTRFRGSGVEPLGRTITVVMHVHPRDGGRTDILMRGYVTRMDDTSGEIKEVGGPQGCVFAKNFCLTPGMRRLDSLIREAQRDSRKGPKAVARLRQRREEMQLDETLFTDARAARPDLENPVMMGCGLDLLIALRAFAEVRRANERLDRLARVTDAGSRAVLVREAMSDRCDPNDAMGIQVRSLAGLVKQAEAVHLDLGGFHFPDFLYAYAKHAPPTGDVAASLREVAGVDGPCLLHSVAREAGLIPSALTQFEDFSSLLADYGVPMYAGQQILEASFEGEGLGKWKLRLAGDPADKYRIVSTDEYLAGMYRHPIPQVVDVVYGQARQKQTRLVRTAEMRFAANGLPVNVSLDDMNPRFTEWRKKNSKN